MKVSNINYTQLISINNHLDSKNRNVLATQGTVQPYNKNITGLQRAGMPANFDTFADDISFRAFTFRAQDTFRALTDVASTHIMNQIFSNSLSRNSFMSAAQSTKELIPGIISMTIEKLKQRCTSLDDYRDALCKLLDGLNLASDTNSDIYESTRIVGDAINNAYYDYQNRRVPAGEPLSQITGLNAEQLNQIGSIVSDFMRLKDKFRIWNYVRQESQVKTVLSNFIPVLRTKCTSLDQYKQMVSIYADNVYSLYRSVQDNDTDGSFYEISSAAAEALNNAESYYNSTCPSDVAAENQEVASTPIVNIMPTSAQKVVSQNSLGKYTLSDVDEINTYLMDIAKKYARNDTKSVSKTAIIFDPPVVNQSKENYYLNSSGNATDIFGEVVLNTTPSDTSNDSTLLKLIQRKDFDPNYRYETYNYNIGCRPIFILTTLNKPYLLQEALKLPGANPNLINGTSRTALGRAVGTNTLDCVYVLLKSGKVDESEIERCKREFTMTPEMKGLLDSYPNMDEYINSSLKSLQALEKINIKTLDDVLRTPNIDVNFVDSNGNNILHASCMLPDKDEAIRLAANALGNKVNINCVNKSGKAPIEIAIKNKNYELAAFLIEKGADLSVFKDELENTFVHTIISIADEDGAIKLLDTAREKGIDFDAGNCSGITPFIQSVKLKKYKIINYLLKCGIITNKTDKFGRTALHYACMLNDRTSLEILLNSFVGTKIKDNDGKYACDYLNQQDLKDFYKMFDSMV